MMFLAFLVFAIHVTVNLWVRSTIMSVAEDAAYRIATSPPGSEGHVIARARGMLGAHAEKVRLSVESNASAPRVVVHVTAEPLGILRNSGIGEIDERIIVRTEDR